MDIHLPGLHIYFFLRELSHVQQPNNKDYFCPKQMLATGYMINKWYWSPVNSFGGRGDKQIPNVNITIRSRYVLATYLSRFLNEL